MDYSDDENNYFRKPNPGMIFFAKKKFDLDLEKSYVIGDDGVILMRFCR